MLHCTDHDEDRGENCMTTEEAHKIWNAYHAVQNSSAIEDRESLNIIAGVWVIPGDVNHGCIPLNESCQVMYFR